MKIRSMEYKLEGSEFTMMSAKGVRPVCVWMEPWVACARREA